MVRSLAGSRKSNQVFLYMKHMAFTLLGHLSCPGRENTIHSRCWTLETAE